MNRETRLAAVNFYGLHLLLALLVLVFSLSVADWFALPKYAVLQSGSLLLFASWTYWYLSSPKAQTRHTGSAPPAVFFVLVVALSTIFSLNPTTSLIGKYYRYEGLLTQVSYLTLFFLSVQLLSDFEMAYKHIKVMVLIAVVASLYGLTQFAGVDIFDWRGAIGSMAGQSTSTFGNRSFLGGFLVLALPLSVAWVLSASGKERWLAGIAGVVIVVTLISTETRASWIGAALGLVFFAILAIKKSKMKMVSLLAVALVVVALIFLVVTMGSLGFDKIREIASRAATLSTGSGAFRLETWKTAFRMIAYRPLLGTGPDTFMLLFARFQSARFSQIAPRWIISDDAHNYFINLAANSGLLGFFAMVTLLIALLWKGIRQVLLKGSLLLSAFLASVISYLVHLSFSVGHVASNAWMWTILGLLSVHLFPLEGNQQSRTKKLHMRFRRPLLIVVLLITLTVTAFAATRCLADFYFAQARGYVESGWIGNAIGSFEEAIRLAPYYSGYRHELALLYVKLSMQRSDLGDLLKARKIAGESIQGDPHNIDGYMILADAYLRGAERFGRVNDAQEAEEVLVRALRIKPQSAVTHFFFARALLARGEKKGAEAHLRKALQVEPDYQAAQKLLAELAREDRMEN